MEETEARSRSFRDEDYNNRRVFLRSYPLQWEGTGDFEGDEKLVRVSKATKGKRKAKKILVCLFHWGGGKVLVLKKLQHKVGFYLVACHPFGFESSTALISV
ncbi:hypothetical protein IFM89_016920 [Coptis chinensis]|uniref:Uncharacterized protein n=1 Tax=Coptis chinensis TaxID=261450 RepID=A0A835HW95_9MAGN|nr:hypothetical protein IFM89_016920 [Coptis chinensis]